MKVCQTCRRCYEDDAVRCVDNTHSPPLEELRVPLELGGRWRIERLVRATDWAAEFVGRHIELGRAATLRVTTPEGAPGASLGRARLAARSLAGVRQEHVARLEDLGALPDGAVYAVIERFGDENLREAIERVGPLPYSDALRLGRQIAEALAAYAARGIAPAASSLDPEEIRIGRDDSNAPIATVGHFPNRDRGEIADLVPRAGGLLYEMLSGRPFTAGAFGSPETISRARPDVPEELAALVDRAVNRSQSVRPGSIAELAEKLRAIERPGIGAETAPAPASASASFAPPEESPAFAPSADAPPPFFRPAPAAVPAAAFTPPPPKPPEPEPPRPAQASQSPAAFSLSPTPASRTASPVRAPEPREPEPPVAQPAAPKARITPVSGVETTGAPPPAPAPPERREPPRPRLDDMALGTEAEPSSERAPRRFSGGIVSTLMAALAVATAAAVWFIIETMPARRSVEIPAAAPTSVPLAADPSPAAEPTAAAAIPPATRPQAATAPPATPARATPADPTQRAVRAALDGWVASTNSRNLNEEMRYYMPRLTTFYQQRNVSRELVRRVKSELFALGPATIRVSDPEILITNDRRAATVRFRKDYDVGGSRGRRRGAVLQELKWIRTDNGPWKIVSERDARVLE